MVDVNAAKRLRAKSVELKKMFKDMNAEMEKWKFSIDDTKEGLRVELHAVSLFRYTSKSTPKRK